MLFRTRSRNGALEAKDLMDADPGRVRRITAELLSTGQLEPDRLVVGLGKAAGGRLQCRDFGRCLFVEEAIPEADLSQGEIGRQWSRVRFGYSRQIYRLYFQLDDDD